MTIRISAAHRDALYDQILDRLSGIDDIWIAVKKEDFAAADNLAEMYCDDLALIRTDLGWGKGLGRSIELRSSVDRLTRVFTRLHEAANGQRESQEGEWAEAREMEERTHLVDEVCVEVLTQLSRQPGAS
jgi:hypothetical protein